MSGANAIHGVVIIGAIIVMGKAESRQLSGPDPGLSCCGAWDIECGGWFCGNRQNAGNV